MTDELTLLVYSPVRQVTGELGLAEYSYAFVLDRFLPVLRTLGAVIHVADEPEARTAVATARDRGSACLLISFAPPDRALADVGCPSLCLFAWEYDTIPNEVWPGNPNADWEVQLAKERGAITLSRHTCEVVRNQLGAGYPVWAVPAPIFDRVSMGSPRDPGEAATMAFHGLVIDSAADDDDLWEPQLARDLADYCESAPITEDTQLLFCDQDPDCGRLVGFHGPEMWGSWSSSANPWILLPGTVAGRVRLTFDVVGYGANAGRTVRTAIGEAVAELALPREFRQVNVDVVVPRPSSVIAFEGLIPTPSAQDNDHRNLGLGLRSLAVGPSTGKRRFGGVRRSRRGPARQSRPPTPPATQLRLDGVVYTTVLNPADGRKNWVNIVTGFCTALGDRPDATLVLKMTHRSTASFLAKLTRVIAQLRPFACRVVAVHGFLTDDQMSHLARASSYYVNASTGEGLCMPLMEFMSAGVPAVAPVHTAMADYLDARCAFPVAHSAYPAAWPQDPRHLWRTIRQRAHLDSLIDALAESYETAVQRPEQYGEMADHARARLAEYCGDDIVRRQLLQAIEVTMAGAG